MEPPGEGRYESGRAGLVVVLLPAAMEPPGEGRYEVGHNGEPDEAAIKPQWSRPVKGGTRFSRGRLYCRINRRNGAAR